MSLISYKYRKHTINKSIFNKIFPSFEIKRYHTIHKLNHIFKKHLMKFKKKYDLTSLEKYNYTKMLDLVNRWCWHQYNNSSSEDSVIPYLSDDNYNYDRFIYDLNYIIGSNITHDDIVIVELKKEIETFLKKEFKELIEKKHISGDRYELTKETKDDYTYFNLTYESKTYQTSIHSKVYDKLKMKLKMFSNELEKELYDDYIFCLLFRYSYMDADNQQLAIIYIIKDMFKSYGVNFELFGSGINTICDNYCSLFYDIESNFGSNGSFFDIQIDEGIYWCNPPYDETIMTNVGIKLTSILQKKTVNKVAFLVTIPVWDFITQNRDNKINILRNHNIKSSLFPIFPSFFPLFFSFFFLFYSFFPDPNSS